MDLGVTEGGRGGIEKTGGRENFYWDVIYEKINKI